MLLFFFCRQIDAAKNGGQHASKNASGGGSSRGAAADAITRKTGMTVDEAMNILNITKDADLAKIAKVQSTNLILFFYTHGTALKGAYLGLLFIYISDFLYLFFLFK